MAAGTEEGQQEEDGGFRSTSFQRFPAAHWLETTFSNLVPFIDDIDMILLSHGDVNHLGGLPYVYSRLKGRGVSGELGSGLSMLDRKVPVVCTDVVRYLGECSLVGMMTEFDRFCDFNPFVLPGVSAYVGAREKIGALSQKPIFEEEDVIRLFSSGDASDQLFNTVGSFLICGLR